MSSRELSWVLILSAFLIWCLSKREVRKQVISIIKILFFNKLILLPLINLVFVISAILLLSSFDLWDVSYLWITIIWYVLINLPLTYKSVETRNIFRSFKKTFIGLIGISAFYEFIVNYYTFSLVTEIILQLVLLLLFSLMYFSKSKEQYQGVYKSTKSILTLIGIVLIIITSYNIYMNITGFISYNTLQIFFLPILLTILVHPSYIMNSIYATYESTFSKPNHIFQHNPKCRKYFKWQVIRCCGLNLEKVAKSKRINIWRDQQLHELKTEFNNFYSAS